MTYNTIYSIGKVNNCAHLSLLLITLNYLYNLQLVVVSNIVPNNLKPNLLLSKPYLQGSNTQTFRLYFSSG